VIMEKAVWRRGEVMKRLGITKRTYYDLVKCGMLKPRLLPRHRVRTYIALSNLRDVEAKLSA